MPEQLSSSAPPRAHRGSKGRSPSYPGISLRQAVERARTLYENERRHSAPMGVITGYWGYRSPKTGPASVAFAGLKKHGLLDEEGSGDERSARLSELALEILLNPDPRAAIQRAALMPPIYREMWEEHGRNLPSDDTLRWRFVSQRGFTETGFEEFIRNYRATIDYAQLATPEGGAPLANDLPTTEEDLAEDAVGQPRQEPTMAPAGGSDRVASLGSRPEALRIPVPLVDGPPVVIEGEFPITEAAWTQLLAVLTAMKPGLVREVGPVPPTHQGDVR